MLINTAKYENLSASLSLFDIKTLAGNWGVYKLLDWSQIEADGKRFYEGFHKPSELKTLLGDEFPLLLEAIDISYAVQNLGSTVKLVRPPEKVILNIKDSLKDFCGRIMPIRFSYKLQSLYKSL